LDVQRLESVSLFAGLDKRERQRVAEAADEIDVEAGRELASQGRFGYEFFAILDGQADVVQDGQQIAELGPGDFFGEIALLESDRRTASVVARTPMTLLVMHRPQFRQLEREMPRIAARVREAITARLGAPRE
jgi:CRP/FNR family cyclic AMP-dependent transcriptional regulator